MKFANIKRHTWKKEEFIAYDNACMRKQDARGREQLAEERGQEKARKEMVLKPYREGKTAMQISDFWGVPLEEVQDIIAEYGGPKNED